MDAEFKAIFKYAVNHDCWHSSSSEFVSLLGLVMPLIVDWQLVTQRPPKIDQLTHKILSVVFGTGSCVRITDGK